VGESIQRTARTPDGRILAIEEAGDPYGRPVLVHNGTPNSRHLYAKNAADAAARDDDMVGHDGRLLRGGGQCMQLAPGIMSALLPKAPSECKTTGTTGKAADDEPGHPGSEV